MIIQFDYLKKIILKAPEYWQAGNGSSTAKSGGGLSAHHIGGVSEIVSTIFTFKDFFKAFKVLNIYSSYFLNRSSQRLDIEMWMNQLLTNFKCSHSLWKSNWILILLKTNQALLCLTICWTQMEKLPIPQILEVCIQITTSLPHTSNINSSRW